MSAVRRYAEADFPDCLMLTPTGPGTAADQIHRGRIEEPRYPTHNCAITDWVKARQGVISDLRPAERRVLDLANATRGWVADSLAVDCYVDPFGITNVVVPMVRAFRASLNYDTGRLICAPLDSWAADFLSSLGVDPDTYVQEGSQ